MIEVADRNVSPSVQDLHLSMLSLRNNLTLTDLHNDCFIAPRGLHMICPIPFAAVSGITCKELGMYLMSRNIYIQSVIRKIVFLLLLAAKFPRNRDGSSDAKDCNMFYGVLNYDLMKIVAKHLYASRNELIWKDDICRGTNFDVKGIDALKLGDICHCDKFYGDTPYLSFCSAESFLT